MAFAGVTGAPGRRVVGEVAEKLALFGLGMSDAVRILLPRVTKDSGLPTKLVTNPDTPAAWFRAQVRETIMEMGRSSRASGCGGRGAGNVRPYFNKTPFVTDNYCSAYTPQLSSE